MNTLACFGLLSRALHKAPVSSGRSRICDTVKEQRNWQRSGVPEAKTEFLALPESRFLR